MEEIWAKEFGVERTDPTPGKMRERCEARGMGPESLADLAESGVFEGMSTLAAAHAEDLVFGLRRVRFGQAMAPAMAQTLSEAAAKGINALVLGPDPTAMAAEGSEDVARILKPLGCILASLEFGLDPADAATCRAAFLDFLPRDVHAPLAATIEETLRAAREQGPTAFARGMEGSLDADQIAMLSAQFEAPLLSDSVDAGEGARRPPSKPRPPL